MANNILREFLVAVGFRVDEAGYKRQTDAVKRVGDQLGKLDHDERRRAEGEARRIAERKRNVEGLGLAVAGFAAAATAAAAVVATAVAKMTGGFDQFYFISQRTGASVNNIKALGYAFTQVGSSAESAVQAIEAFARTRRTNPGIEGLLKSYGVDTKGDTADVLGRSIEAIQNRHPYYTGAQVAGLLGITEDQFKTFTTYREEIRKFREEYARTQTSFGVNSDATARASASVTKSVNALVMMLGVLTEKIYMAVAPALERVVKGIKDWIEANPEKVEAIMKGIADALEAVGKALIAVGDWFANDENRKRFVDFWSNFADLVKNVTRLIGFLLDSMFKLSNFLQNSPLGKVLTFNPVRDYLFGGSASGGGGAGGGLGIGAIGGASFLEEAPQGGGTGAAGKPNILRRGWDAIKRATGFGPKEDKTNYNFTGKNADVLRQAAKELGTSPEDLATVISYETGGKFSPSIWGGKGGNYMGLIQFGPSERNQFGANDKQTFAEQMPAVVRYLKSRGFKPGMGLLDLYSTINAGRPGRYNASDGNGTVRSHVENMRRTHGARAQRFLNSGDGPAAANQNIPAPTPRSGFSPGNFNVDDALRSSPMGSTSSNTDNSRTVSQNNPVTVNVQGANDPAATGAAVGRAVGQANDMGLRNVQTAIR